MQCMQCMQCMHCMHCMHCSLSALPATVQRCNDEPAWPPFVLLVHWSLFASLALQC
jgi:hypothetical protein